MVRNQVRIDIERRDHSPVAALSQHRALRALFGKVHFAIDPDEKGLPSIVDLDLAPFVPLPRRRRARGARRPRPSIEERYPSHAAYIAAVTGCARSACARD